jgi:hypothetical protein
LVCTDMKKKTSVLMEGYKLHKYVDQRMKSSMNKRSCSVKNIMYRPT